MNDLLTPLLGPPLEVELLKHKPGRRRTLRVRGSHGSVIVKQYASSRAAVVAARVAALADGPPEPVLPRVLAVESKRRLVVLTDVPGQPLTRAVLSSDLPACRRAGSALGRWHAAWWGRVPAALRPHTAERELELLQSRAAVSSPGIGSAVAAAGQALAWPWRCPTAVHRDLYEEQILAPADGPIGLIDLDDAAAGPPELDVGNLVAHLDLLAFRTGRDPTEAVAALLSGYAATGPPLDTEQLQRCRQLTLLRLVCLHAEPALLAACLKRVPPPL